MLARAGSCVSLPSSCDDGLDTFVVEPADHDKGRATVALPQLPLDVDGSGFELPSDVESGFELPSDVEEADLSLVQHVCSSAVGGVKRRLSFSRIAAQDSELRSCLVKFKFADLCRLVVIVSWSWQFSFGC